MKFDHDEVAAMVNRKCQELRAAKMGDYTPPECFPGVESTQVKAVVEVMVELLNKMADKT